MTHEEFSRKGGLANTEAQQKARSANGKSRGLRGRPAGAKDKKPRKVRSDKGKTKKANVPDESLLPK
jgi:hypothetical protein